MTSFGVLLHYLALALDLLQVFEKAVNAESLLEDSDGFDVVGVILGLNNKTAILTCKKNNLLVSGFRLRSRFRQS